MVFTDFTKDCSGIYPFSLFKENAHYDFDPTVFTTRNDYQQEVKNLVLTMHHNGYNVYIRDVSYLGFPAVFVYIPKVSAMGRKITQSVSETKKFNISELDKIEDIFFSLSPSTNETEMRQIADLFSNLGGRTLLGDIFNMKFKNKSTWSSLTIDFFLTQLWYRLGEFNKAKQSFDGFLENRKEKPEYYKVIAEYLKLKAEKYDDRTIQSKLEQSNFESKVIKKVCMDMDDPEKIFRYIKLPRCPDCLHCDLQNDCLTKTQMEISHRLYSKHQEKVVDQKNIFSLLHD
jgi:hypothetical protein